VTEHHSRIYREGRLIGTDLPPDEVADRLEREPGTAAWLDLYHPTRPDLDLLRDRFGVHRLAIEDVLHGMQRAKLDRYDGHMFLSAYLARLRNGTGLDTTEVSAFLTPRALITVRDSVGVDVKQLQQRWDENVELAGYGVGFLLYGLLDLLVDSHFDAAQRLDTTLDDVEESLFAEDVNPSPQLQRQAYQARRDLVRLRQVVLPMREVVNAVMRPTTHIVDPAMLPFYQDVYDHVVRATEWTESLRDLVTSALEANLTAQGNRQNIIMKKVTSWAAIIAVPTAVTSFYGQNLPLPGRDRLWGAYLSLAISVALGVWLYITLRRKDWL
jgi:magnesium transporter